MDKEKKIPIYAVDFTDDSVWNSISIVDFPAIEKDFLKLSKQADVKLSINDEKREISGPVLIPNQLVYRRDSNSGKEYYIKFTEDSIKKMAIEFFKRGTQNNGNVMHQINVNGITFFESYLINKERNLCPKEFEDLPNGSWIVTARVNNNDVWDAIKNGELKGFSIDVENVQFNPETKSNVLNSIEELLDYLNNN